MAFCRCWVGLSPDRGTARFRRSISELFCGRRRRWYRERRHRPAAWTVFGVGQAIVAGDALLALAQELLLDDSVPRNRQAAKCHLAIVIASCKGGPRSERKQKGEYPNHATRLYRCSADL